MTDGAFVVFAAGSYSDYELVFDYDTPFQPDSQGIYKIYWQKQPGTLNDAVEVTWQTGGPTYKTSGDLSQDRMIVLAPTSVSLAPGQTSAAQLPGLSF